MGTFEVIRKFIKSSGSMEKAALNMYAWLPLSFRNRIFYGPAYFRWLSFLKESETWDKDRFDRYQFEQAKTLLMHAMRNVPYYRKLFSEIGFHPEKMQGLDELSLLPCLHKETVRAGHLAFVDERIPPGALVRKATSGSTGIPLTVYRSRESSAAFHAFRANIVGRTGFSPKSREVMLWSLIEAGKRKDLPFMRFGNKLAVSIRYLTGEWISQSYRVIREFDPEYITGYPSALSMLSSYIKNKPLSPFRNVRAAISYAETLYDWQKELIEQVFGRVFSFYSMTERAAIGGECEYSSYLHLHPAYSVIELGDAVNGYKEIIATGIANGAMPFIRYRTGDLVTASPHGHCSQCGRHHIIVSRMEGRTRDFLIGINGEIIPRLMPVIEIFPHVRQLQFYQEEPGKACLHIVREKAFTEADAQSIRTKLDEMLGVMKDRIDIEIVPVDIIHASSSGKMKMVEQKLDMKDFL
jgi:phenylacetate-coenzyme A ligase PaaK-like adenylate-forming protein